MGQHDLRDYAHASEKLTPDSLIHEGKPSVKVTNLTLLCAYAFDGCVVLFGTIAAMLFLETSASNLMVTKSLMQAYDQMDTSLPAFATFWEITTGYFFFSYFFNQGQTWGKSLFNCRIQISSMSYRESFRWAIFSSLVLGTCGLFLLFKKVYKQMDDSGVYAAHDHKYLELMKDKVIYPVNLIELTSETNDHEKEQDFDQVA